MRVSAQTLANEPQRKLGVPSWLRVALRAVVLGGLYAAIYKLVAVESSFGTTVGATFWPASGVTVSVLVLRPRKEWPAYVAAVFLADFAMDVSTAGFSPHVSIGLAAANCAEPLLSASLLNSWLRSRPDLSRLRDLGLFYVAAAGAGPMLSAVISSVWQWVLGAQPLWPFIGRWYVGDALGVVVVAPLILALARSPSPPTLRLSHSWAFGLVLVLAAVGLPWRFDTRIGLAFMVIPALSLVGIRMGTRGVAAAAFVVGVLVEIVTSLGLGPFATGGPFDGLLSAQMYVAACSASGLITAALMSGLISRGELALHDSLTGLANRRLLIDRVSVACGHLARTPGTVGLVFIDLDDFKTINDAFGHATGDRVLRATARRLQSVVRDEETIARIGGDEFVILVDRVADQQALPNLVARVTRAITEPIADDDVVIEIGASIGFAVTDRHDDTHDALLARADAAMYAVKRARPEPALRRSPDRDPLTATR